MKPISAADAEWIRAVAFTAPMRKTHRDVPDFYTTCACQYALSTYCMHGPCSQCHRAAPQTFPEGFICRRGGEVPAHHANGTIATVWLADRICRWLCPCDCHSRPAVVVEQLDLFAAVS